MSGSFSYTPQVQGWLMKQRHGICKSWLRRFFVLDGNELRYYKNEMDSVPQCVINLENYQVVTDVIPVALPLILKKQPQRQYTFLLLYNDKQKTERSDLFLQAETKEELDIWVNALQLHQLNDSTSVLDKWLERLDDMHSTTPPQAPHSASATTITSTSASSSFLSPTKQQRQHHLHQTRPPLRGHRSSESLASSVSSAGSHSTATTSHRSSFAELRRTSNPSTLSSGTSSPSTAKDNKFFANLFHHWPRSKSPARGASPSPPPPSREGFYDDQQQQQQGSSEAVVIAPALPIIHPSEYNKMYEEDDDETSSSSNNDATTTMTTSSSLSGSSSSTNNNNNTDATSNDDKKSKRQSLASRRNIQVAPITNPNRLSRGRSCSSLVMSDSSTDSIVDRFPRVLTTPTLGASSVNGGASFDQPAN